MTKEILIEFVVEGRKIGSGWVSITSGEVSTSSIEDSFYEMLRKNENSWKAEAEEEEHESLVDHLTPEQEDKLKEKHAEDYHGTDDDMPDDYEDWLMKLTAQEIKDIIK